MGGTSDVWAGGGAYESYVGRWSRVVARKVVRELAVEPRSRWLDVGCGTGAISRIIAENADLREVVGIDPSESYVAHARTHVPDPRVVFTVGDAQALPFEAAA